MAQQNKELLDQIEHLSKQRGYPVKTDGLNNQQLQSLLSELQNAPGAPAPAGATRKSSNQDPRLPDGPGTQPGVVQELVGDGPVHGGVRANASTDVQRAQREGRDAQSTTANRTFPYAVAPGKSISTPRGLLDAGAEVKPDDVGGQERLDHLIEKGAVVRGGDAARPGEPRSGAGDGTKVDLRPEGSGKP